MTIDPSASIHPTAIVNQGAVVGPNVEIGPFVIIHENVEIGRDSSVGAYCELGISTPLSDGSPLVIRENSTIRSRSTFYEGSSFGSRLITGHGITVREGVSAGENLQIGTLGDIQGTCTIGNYVRFHSNVHIGKHSKIEDFVWIFPFVVLTNDPHPPSDVQLGVIIKRFASIATMSTILPGVEVGEGALVGACSNVGKNVGEHRVVAGNPAEDRGPTERIRLRDGTRRPAYPWTRHFSRGYPEEIVRKWHSEAELSNG